MCTVHIMLHERMFHTAFEMLAWNDGMEATYIVHSDIIIIDDETTGVCDSGWVIWSILQYLMILVCSTLILAFMPNQHAVSA